MDVQVEYENLYGKSCYAFTYSNIGFMNALRRIILSEIPCLAIDDVLIYNNDQLLESEILAHRLGLVPLKWNENISSNAEINMDLHIENISMDTQTIYAKDIIIHDPDVEFIYDTMPITKLRFNDRVHFKSIARFGKAIDHSKYKVVSVCYIKQIDDNSFHLIIETIGAYTTRQILQKALEILKQKINTIHLVPK